MGIFLATLTGLVVWIVLWALGAKSFDAFMLTLVIILLGCMVHVLAPFLPGNRKDSPPPGA